MNKLTQQVDKIASNGLLASDVGEIHKLDVGLSTLAFFDATKKAKVKSTYLKLTGEEQRP
jgi:hypothetical protein